MLGDDFDWLVRDYDSFRRFMLEELAARFPERTRWTPADMEVVLVEVLAAVLDQLSDMLDRVATESYLETARRPETVRRLLALIGFDAATAAGLTDEDSGAPNAQSKEQQLEAALAPESDADGSGQTRRTAGHPHPAAHGDRGRLCRTAGGPSPGAAGHGLGRVERFLDRPARGRGAVAGASTG